MNAPVTISTEATIRRRRREIAELIEALRKEDHWLEKAEYWSRLPVIRTAKGPRAYASCMDLAEECQPDILMAMYRYSEIDAIHDAWKERGQ